ncbi:ATP-binding protein, partial [Hyalangium sp.]|uniref:ATP-binding protein n=1 Tax=Hyalangium sp. TaxID=2028555 RepID=UPI002D6425B8
MLDAAHRGYDYQDLLIATRLTDVLLGTVVEIWVDEKLFSEDRFDDLTTVDLDHRRERTQFKHKDNASLALPLATFTSEDRDLRLDKLVACAIAEREGPGRGATTHTFRVVLRDARPTDPRLTRVLKPAEQDPGPYVPGMRSLRLRFDPDVLWPLSTSRADEPSGKDAFAFLRDGRLIREDLLWLCERLIIEVEAPAASFDLVNPGPAELLLLERMRRDIGAEAYPNRERTATDVAEALIRSATAARLRRVTVSLEELLRRTRLRHDFGAVARAHPVDSAVEVHRPATVSEVIERAETAADEGSVLLLLGPPGQGKSWACHQVVNALTASKWLVAEHYCFLGEADFELQVRVLGERVFGSLLGRLAETEPALVTQQRPRFAADESALAEALHRARESQPDRRIALVVDGIDHVTRVLGATTRRIDPSRALAEALASLDLPIGSVLIVLSQPGEHLRPLQEKGATIVMVPAFGPDELRTLAERLGVLTTPKEPDRNSPTANEATGLIDANDEDVVVDFLNALSERSAGNALYATYLCREALRLPTARVDPAGGIRLLPPFDGTLGAYYEHLVAALDHGSSWVADIVALLDFAVTRVELREIWPEMGHRIDAALDRLEPVLIERATQGGVRVYHESFARFLRQPLRDNPKTAVALLGRVADWLSSKGMFTDARAFLFLLPTLARAGRDEEVVKLINVDFTALAVAGGFSATAIKANLCTAIGCATRVGDWPAVVRCVELARAAGTYEFDNLDSKIVEFADVPMALLGAGAFADRLLYDGRTTVPSRAGLQLCAIVDKAGVAAPWREYMTAFDRERREDNTAYGSESEQHIELALLRGRLRLAVDSSAASAEQTSAKTVSDNGVGLINSR